MSITENIRRVRAEIAEAAAAAGRRPEEITLVGASKMNDTAACREAVAGGIDALGENRVQELLKKYAEDAYIGAPLHFIGHLQRNKVRQIVGKVDLIQSVGSLELLAEIQRCAEKLDLVQNVLLEVNIGGEESKSGFAPEAVYAAAQQALELPNIRALGLMTIPPVEVNPGDSTQYFEKVRALYVDMNSNLFHNKLECLSMGMSGDFAQAIRAGATMVRVGTAIFGTRDYT
ncbi:MAG: YggS family pyridoxal phosphate-dependent enzyme [Ruminococcaceae bacterium]|nr:YggS family pyridoxal phosphate-dependent enzyme [Oscillospiraceae bacterium]